MKLIIGNKNYSSWSLRAYLAAAAAGASFEELVIPLDRPETRALLIEHSPSERVPVLVDGDLTIWDSLAIAEYLAELYPSARLWPGDPTDRALARSVTAEMHSGFVALRRDMPMDIRGRRPGAGHTGAALDDAARVQAIWRLCRDRCGGRGEFLFEHFTIADAFYAPVTTRFVTYRVALDDVCQRYIEAVAALPAMRAWTEAAAAEPWEIPPDDIRL